MNQDGIELATRLTAAVERHDLTTVESLLSDDFIHWFNFNQVEMPKAAALANMQRLFDAVASMRFTGVRRLPTPQGAVQQVMTEIVFKDDERKPHRTPNCTVVTVRDGKIVRLEEYMNAPG